MCWQPKSLILAAWALTVLRQVTTDTVAETLLFAARLKNPGISLVEARDNVARVLDCLKLTHIANSSDTLDSGCSVLTVRVPGIGNGVSGGGISGGERKRVSIGVELVCAAMASCAALCHVLLLHWVLLWHGVLHCVMCCYYIGCCYGIVCCIVSCAAIALGAAMAWCAATTLGAAMASCAALCHVLLLHWVLLWHWVALIGWC